MESQVVNDWLRRGGEFGKLEMARQDLLRGLARKFPGAVPPEIVDLISTQESLAVLQDWHDSGFCATTFDEFVAVLKR